MTTKRNTTRKRSTRTVKSEQPDFGQPREWDRGTALISLFIATGKGYIVQDNDIARDPRTRVKPASLLFVSPPGQGKTELLDRFRPNRSLSYKSDLTSRGFWRVLKEAREGVISHIVATEFQKFFQRKIAVAENTLGIMVQSMEEGVDVVDVGMKQVRFGGVRCGLLGAITHGTLDRKREFLDEMGFLSRAAVIEWNLPLSEKKIILQHIVQGNSTDVQPVELPLPDEAVPVAFDADVAQPLVDYVWRSWKESSLRMMGRMRSLCMAAALLDGRDVVQSKDLDNVLQYDDYWQRMIME